MVKELKIENKVIDIYYKEKSLKELPVVILNIYGKEGQEVWNKCLDIKCKDYILVSISNLNWNNEMTPWYSEKINEKGEEFLGKADEYIQIMLNEIIPKVKNYIERDLEVKIKYYIISGYSLAGLFAIYASYKTNIFSKIVSASGSLWFPKFVDFVKENKISSNVEKIYFSLGNKESKVKNQILANVEKNTKEIEEIYKKQGIKTIYVENEGNHFKDAPLRLAKGIKWILE